MLKQKQQYEILSLERGDAVEIRSREEILQTLDENGEIDGLPFMPEMLKFCGQQLTVYRRAEKTCDTIDNLGAMRMNDAVHFTGLRCDGSSHDGCQAECMLFWKEAWLKKMTGPANRMSRSTPLCTEEQLHQVTRSRSSTSPGTPVYSCQATELKRATTPLPWWDLRQYIRDIRNGCTTPLGVLKAGIFSLYRELVNLGVGYKYLIGAYDWLQDRIGGQRFPFRHGKLTGKTPTGELNLQVGDYVRVRTHDQILETLNKNNKNRGLWFDAEMVQHCEKIFRVEKRVNKIINEKTGEMMEFGNPCIVLENVYCYGRFTKLRLFCPRHILSYWREIWLDRVSEDEIDS